MRVLDLLASLFWVFSSAQAYEIEELDKFLDDLIYTWQLSSPTIIVQGDLPKICMRHQWLLCLSDNMDTTELAYHVALNHQLGKQDGIILVGTTGHAHLLGELAKINSYLLTTNYPMFMPTAYKNDINFRLDSNIILFNESPTGNWKILDIFAVKNGPTISLEIGNWDTKNGIVLQKSLNRWDRRTDLKGTTFVNCFASNPGFADFVRDENDNIMGSTGSFQEMLYYITGNLNLTFKIVEAPWEFELLENGSWTGEMGLLQRKEVDVVSSVLGITLQRSNFVDYPFPTDYHPLTLHAAIPKGSAPNMWVFLRVFGPYQWMVFVALLVLLVVGLHFITLLSPDKAGKEFGTKRGASKNYHLNSALSEFALVCLYTIQMGSHTNSKLLASRLLTLTMSMLTFLLFAYYTTDITSEMTSGAPEIPIRTFEDVVHYNYRVVTNSPYYANLLKRAKLGTAMNTVYNNRFEMKETFEEALEEVVKDPKTLFYSTKALLRGTRLEKALVRQTFPLNMDDGVNVFATLALQKDSEFLQLFNHYILKAYETGIFKRSLRKRYMDLYTNENYEMVEPQPLGLNNVMFLFIVLAVGMCFSITNALMEYTMMKFTKLGGGWRKRRGLREKESRRPGEIRNEVK